MVVPFEAIDSCLEFALVLTGAWLARHCTRNLAIIIFSMFKCCKVFMDNKGGVAMAPAIILVKISE